MNIDFLASSSEHADTDGALNRRAIQPRDDSRTSALTPIFLEFALNAEPSESVLNSLTHTTSKVLGELILKNETLERYSEEFVLEIGEIGTTSTEENDEKCPAAYENCALVSTIVWFHHSRALDSGSLEMEVLNESKKDFDAILASDTGPLEAKYLGRSLSSIEYSITFTGVPSGARMNDVQRRYFEDVTKYFLRKSSTSKIYSVIVINEIPEAFPLSQNRNEQVSGRSLFDDSTMARSGFLRKRDMETTASNNRKIEIIAEIVGEGSVQESSNSILKGIGEHLDSYSNEFSTQPDHRSFFGDAIDIQVKPRIHRRTNRGFTLGEVRSRILQIDGGKTSPWLVVCVLLILFSVLWILYRIYKDCFYAPVEQRVRIDGSAKPEIEEKIELSGTIDHVKTLLGSIKNPLQLGKASDSHSMSGQTAIDEGEKSRSNHLKSQTTPRGRSKSRGKSQKRPVSSNDPTFYDNRDLEDYSSDEESAPKRPSHKSLPLSLDNQNDQSSHTKKHNSSRSLPVDRHNEIGINKKKYERKGRRDTSATKGKIAVEGESKTLRGNTNRQTPNIGSAAKEVEKKKYSATTVSDSDDDSSLSDSSISDVSRKVKKRVVRRDNQYNTDPKSKNVEKMIASSDAQSNKPRVHPKKHKPGDKNKFKPANEISFKVSKKKTKPRGGNWEKVEFQRPNMGQRTPSKLEDLLFDK
ncbi:unnamed protein product [Pseudo-nitzschia multistriata]|uniref:Uncharacterized protein n=1 Tax=Pseudo-nitzschia multistriata TaxID=183589 RepID=A0A448Z8B8_9STRA|nr:unnamed protein product [Pseudo-nitzschia multistriata]